jgi:hypothetical protein
MRKEDSEKEVAPRQRPLLARSILVFLPLFVLGALALLLYALARLNWTGWRAGVSIGLVGGLVFVSVTILWTLSKRLRAVGAQQKLASDPRPVVLYLRSFEDDQTPLTATDTHEANLASVMEEVGPFVAIGRPGDKLPPAGAARRYLKYEDWQQVVREEMSRSRAVVVQAGATGGLLWEIEAAFKYLRPAQLLVSLRTRDRPINFFGDADYRERYERFRSSTERAFPRPLPLSAGRATFIGFDEGWEPRLLRPTRWRPYNLSPTAKIRETLRPHLARQGVKFGFARTRLQWIIMSLLLAFGILFLVGLVLMFFLE